jgi:hypothetical protein
MIRFLLLSSLNLVFNETYFTNFLYAGLNFLMSVTCCAHLIPRDFIMLITSGGACKLCGILQRIFLGLRLNSCAWVQACFTATCCSLIWEKPSFTSITLDVSDNIQKEISSCGSPSLSRTASSYVTHTGTARNLHSKTRSTIRNKKLIQNLTPWNTVELHLPQVLTLNKLCILPTQCICVFRVVLTINSDYFPEE